MKKIVGILLIIFLSLIFLLYTKLGTSLVFITANALIPGLSIQTRLFPPQGTLAKAFTLDHLQYQSKNFYLAIEGLKINWKPYGLLSKNLTINDLTYNKLVYCQIRTIPSANNWYSHHFKLDLKNASLHHTELQLNPHQMPITLERLTIWQPTHNSQTITWLNFSLPIKKIFLLQSNSGSGQILGNRQHYTVSAQANIQGKNVPVGQWQIKGTGTLQSINLTQIAAKLAEHDLGGYIKIQWDPCWHWQFKLHNQNNSLETQGQLLANQWYANWKIYIPEIARLIPNNSGSIQSVGTISGLKNTPLIHTNIIIKKLKLADYNIDKLESNLDLNLNDQSSSSAYLLAENLKFNKINLNKLQLSGKGSAKQHTINIAIQNKQLNTYALLQGNYFNHIWQGQLIKNQWQLKSLGFWSLVQATNIQLSPQQMRLSQTFWQNNKQQELSLQGGWKNKEDWNLVIDAKKIMLQNFQALLPKAIHLTGLLDLRLAARNYPNQPPQGSFKLQIYPSEFTYHNNQIPQNLAIRSGNIAAELTPAGITSKLQLTFEQQRTLNGELALPDYKDFVFPQPKQKLVGMFTVNWKKLDFLAIWWPQLRSIQGNLLGKIALSGTVGSPQITGQIQLEKGQTEIPSLGITLKNINIITSGKQNKIISFQGQGQSGNGILHIQGITQLDDLATHLILQGENIQILNTNDYQINASPKLNLNYEKNQIKLTGQLFIPQARLTPSKIDRLSVPDDLIIITTAKRQPKTSLKFASDIQLLLGDHIYTEIDGLHGKITGKLFIHEPFDGLAIANGELNIVDGDYQAYGQSLAIRNGQLMFAGSPLTDPGLNIQAIHNVQDTQTHTSIFNSNYAASSSIIDHIIGINVRGTLKNPRFNLFSEPSDLTQTDILSYLILGRPSGQANQADAQLLFQAASALSANNASSQLEHVKQQLQRQFGLDELNIAPTPLQTGSTTLQNTSLILGKHLSPRLYINYSIGLLEPINTLTIRYLLSSKWSLQSQANSIANSIDLFYTLERE